MALGSALPMLVLCGCSLAIAVQGARWLQVDVHLRERIKGRASVGGGGKGGRGIRAPHLPLTSPSDRIEIEKGLRRAGHFEPGAVEMFVWLRLAAAAVAALISMTVCFVLNGSPLKPLFPTLCVFGLTWILAKYVLKMRADARERKLMIEFPFLLDLMLMMLESGVSLDQCFRAIARDERIAVPNHSRLIGMLVDDLDRGQDYQVAFDRWAARVAVYGSRELATLFRQSLFHGLELVPALREFIREFSNRRVARAREAIGTITVRMVILMLIFFMPALFIVLAGPPLAAILDTLSSTH